MEDGGQEGEEAAERKSAASSEALVEEQVESWSAESRHDVRCAVYKALESFVGYFEVVEVVILLLVSDESSWLCKSCTWAPLMMV